MKRTYCATAGLLVLGSVCAAVAQTQAADAPLPVARIALIDTAQFADEKTGITRFVSATKRVVREFHGDSEVLVLRARIQTLTEEIAELEATSSVDRDALQAKKAESERLQAEAKKKNDAYTEVFERRLREVLEPIYRDIGLALEEFARKRGATMVLDIAKLTPALLTFDPAADVTNTFIAEYNKNHP